MSEKERIQKERVVFATLVMEHARGTIEQTLKGAPVGVCEELGRIWDSQCNVPVGVLFNRPNFEEYETINKAAAGGEN